jgi:hypothetical protein
MSEPTQITVTFKELAELLVRRENICKGHWGIFIKFGFSATNIQNKETEQGETSLLPAAIVPVLNIGIQKFDAPNNLTVDASKIAKERTKPKTGRKSKAQQVS